MELSYYPKGMAKIALLSDELINQIAAGEVVERPASVVKELCENAVDATAKTIRVTVECGGLSAVTVMDDGVGMSRADAVLSLQRHATSKLLDLEGLSSIESMGFRGEALPSIAAVSRFALTTSEQGAPLGTRVEVDGGKTPRAADAAPVGGTVVDVRDLFFNVPARRKYMKQAATELRHVQDAVVRLSLAYPEVGFFLSHESRELFASPGGQVDPKERLCAALGAEAYPHLLEIHEERLGLIVTGYVASPELTLPNARGLYTFVNRRYVRDRSLNFSIQRAFSPLLAPGRQPVGVILIQMDPRSVDVNVHPQKMEVRFLDGREVTDAVHAAVFRAVKSAPWLEGHRATSHTLEASPHYDLAVHQFLARAQGGYGFGPPVPPGEPLLFAGEGPRAKGFGEARPDRNAAPTKGYFSSLRFLGEVKRRLWAFEGPGGSLVALDVHAAFERLAATELARLVLARQEGEPAAAPFPRRVDLSAATAEAVLARRGALLSLGIEAAPFGGGTLTLGVAPGVLAHVDWGVALDELIPALPLGEHAPKPHELGGAVAVLACHAARREERSHSHNEVRRAQEQLDAADFGCSVLHGRPVVLEAPLLMLLAHDGKI
jgi:DNA mismatch repair protein MutL